MKHAPIGKKKTRETWKVCAVLKRNLYSRYVFSFSIASAAAWTQRKEEKEPEFFSVPFFCVSQGIYWTQTHGMDVYILHEDE